MRNGPAERQIGRGRGAGALSFWLVPAMVLAAACLPMDAIPSAANEGVALAEVFETPEAYSRRRVDPADLAAFFARYPAYQADSARVADFYARRDMQFAWFVDDSLSASAEAFIALAGMADSASVQRDSLGPHLTALVAENLAEGRRTGACDTCAVHLELHLTAEFFRFVARQYGGYFQRDLGRLGWFIPRAKKDLDRLADSLAAGTMNLAAYEPLHPQYPQLKAELARFHALAGAEWPVLALPAGRRAVEPGDSLALVGEVRHRLELLGDVAANSVRLSYDSALVQGVRRFQERHGLSEDGIIGPDVLRALNVTPVERRRTLLVNMERLRWMPDDPPADLLLVNIPEFRLHVYQADTLVMRMPVVVGAVATRTVVFSDTVSMVVLSPTWTVPADITRDEILPAWRADPDYLRKQNMEVIGGTDEAPVVRQRPGPNNALGRVKFLFPNSHYIYMHDTPERALFARDRRAFSHGCIRLAQPRALAEYLLRDAPAWPPERIREAMLGGVETMVPLTRRVPVMITYFTAWVDDAGRLNFRDDIYGHDQQLAAELFRDH